MSATGGFIYFDPADAVTVTFKAANQGWKRGISVISGPSDWETVPPTFNSFFYRLPDVPSFGTSCLSSKHTRRNANSWIVTFCFRSIV